MFLDEATIEVRGGHGGRGCVGFRREKYIPFGGPNGGNGARGGDVYVVCDENTDTLSDFLSRKKFEAPKGGFGLGKNCNGKDGEDLMLRVPPGTLVTQVITDGKGTEKLVALGDLSEHGEMMLIAHGGRGGFGNAHFKSSVRQTPDFAELGEPGEQLRIKLELKLVADIGIIGYPSVGKSTLISVISSAKPKIADYPFTTLVPNLGVVTVDDRNYVVCDIPGLIEGASEGKGLGHEFLRHIERCGALVHVLDVSRCLREGEEPDAELLINDYKAIRKELSAYSPTLAEKRELVILNKTDLVDHDPKKLESALKKAKIAVVTSISCATMRGVDDLKKSLLKVVLEERAKRVAIPVDDASASPGEGKVIPVLRPHLTSERMGAYRIGRATDGSIVISGKRIVQFTVMTDFGNDEGERRFLDVLDRIGLKKAIKKLRTDDAIKVYIGSVRVDSYL
ncbi:GTPase ObgE [Candidatus Peribacteria bacterium]|nr:GTPase ObgE [Candidatus Peribacteria bacterium]